MADCPACVNPALRPGQSAFMPPPAGRVAVSVALSAQRLRIDLLQDDAGVTFRHSQRMTMSQLDVRLAQGLSPHLGFELSTSLRSVRSETRYADLVGAPYVPLTVHSHQPNESFVGVSDPLLAVTLGVPDAAWSPSARLGVHLPLGATEADPFDYARHGLRHEHVLFGTGTIDPAAGLAVSRRFAGTGVGALATGRFVLAGNRYRHRVGSRYEAAAWAERGIAAAWRARVGWDVSREQAERWSGAFAGASAPARTDAFVTLGLAHASERSGTFAALVRVTQFSRRGGDEVRFPASLLVSWGR